MRLCPQSQSALVLSYPPSEKGKKKFRFFLLQPKGQRPAAHLSPVEVAVGDTTKGERELQVPRAAPPPQQHCKGRSLWLHPPLPLRPSLWGEVIGQRSKGTGLPGRPLCSASLSRAQGSRRGYGSTGGGRGALNLNCKCPLQAKQIVHSQRHAVWEVECGM